MKLVKFLAAFAACALLFGCAKKNSASKTVRIGIAKIVQHPALDAATQGFCDKLTELLGDKVNITVQNGAGDQPSCAVIASQFVSDGVDLIMAIEARQ